jgi:DNA-binding transcriptional regulator YdaS (Cro superfamily)
MARIVGKERVLEMIRIHVRILGSQKEAAKEMKVSEQYLSDALKGRREIGAKILDYFGLERVVSYRRVDGGKL